MFAALPVRQVYVDAGERVRLIDDIHPGQSVDRGILGAIANIGQISRCAERLHLFSHRWNRASVHGVRTKRHRSHEER